MNCVERYYNSEFKNSDRPAIIFYNGLKSLKDPKRIVSFRELTEKSLRARQYLRSIGLERGDVVLMFEAPSPNMYAMILAMLAMGIQILLVEPWMPLQKINSIIKKTRPKGFMAGLIGKAWGLRSKSIRGIPHWIRSDKIDTFRKIEKDMPIESMRDDDNAILTFTSGTSGDPKGVHRKHKYLIDQALTLKSHLPPTTEKLDLTIFTNLALLNLGMGKGSLLIPSRWPARAIKDLDKLPSQFTPDSLACGPGFLKVLLENAKVPSLKRLHFGGALADISLYKKALSNWPDSKLEHIYGSSEAEPVAISDLREAVSKSEEQGHFQTLFLGRPVPEIEIRQESGSFWVSGPHVSPLYEGDDEANKKNKKVDEKGKIWHNMGDMISIDQGLLWYQGRDFQRPEDFQLEQTIYHELGHSKVFIHLFKDKRILVGEIGNVQAKKLVDRYPIDEARRAKIVRDARHRARIDRVRTLKRSKKIKL